MVYISAHGVTTTSGDGLDDTALAATAFNDKLNMHYNFGFHPWTHIDHTSTNEYKFVHTGIDVSKAVALTEKASNLLLYADSEKLNADGDYTVLSAKANALLSGVDASHHVPDATIMAHLQGNTFYDVPVASVHDAEGSLGTSTHSRYSDVADMEGSYSQHSPKITIRWSNDASPTIEYIKVSAYHRGKKWLVGDELRIGPYMPQGQVPNVTGTATGYISVTLAAGMFHTVNSTQVAQWVECVFAESGTILHDSRVGFYFKLRTNSKNRSIEIHGSAATAQHAAARRTTWTWGPLLSNSSRSRCQAPP